MPKLLDVRAALGVMGLVGFAFLLLSLDPFLSATPFAGAATSNQTPAVSVNRDLKGDRLPVRADLFNPGATRNIAKPRSESGVVSHADAPKGCDPAFSPIFTPKLSNVYRRCLT